MFKELRVLINNVCVHACMGVWGDPLLKGVCVCVCVCVVGLPEILHG